MYFAKQKHESIFYHNYKKYDNLKFKEAVDRELMKHDVNNIYYKSSHEIVLSILNVHAPFKKNHLRENHVTFITKVLREKKIMKRARPRNAYFKKSAEATKGTYNHPQIVCVSLLKKFERSYILKTLTVFRFGGQSHRTTSFSPVTSANVRISLKTFLAFSFNPFSTLM